MDSEIQGSLLDQVIQEVIDQLKMFCSLGVKLEADRLLS